MKTILEIAESQGLRTFLASLKKSGLISIINQSKTFTAFAPNDNAYAKLPQRTLTEIMKQEERLFDLTSYHLVEGKILLKNLKNSCFFKTLHQQELIITPGAQPTVNQVKIIQPDIEGDFAVIHIIDEVLNPYAKR